MLLSPGTHTTVRTDEGYMPEFVIPLCGRKVEVVSYVKWTPDCASGVYRGLSHYHVIEVPAPRSPSGVVRRFCIPAAYIEPYRTRTEP